MRKPDNRKKLWIRILALMMAGMRVLGVLLSAAEAFAEETLVFLISSLFFYQFRLIFIGFSLFSYPFNVYVSQPSYMRDGKKVIF